MPRRIILHSDVYQGEHIVTRARIEYEDGTVLSPSDSPGWGLTVFDHDTGDQLFSISSQPASGVIVPLSLIGWDEDSTGYNFSDVRTPAHFARSGGHALRLEYQIDTNNEGDADLLHFVRVIPLWSI